MRVLTSSLLQVVVFCICISVAVFAHRMVQAAKTEDTKSFKGISASLAVGKKECRADALMEVTITLALDKNEGGQRLFNPFFNELLTPPGRILVRDHEGKVVNDLLENLAGSHRTVVGEGDYVYLISGGFVGRKIDIYPARRQENPEVLPPGDYTMELVLRGSLLGMKGQDATREIITTERVAFRIVK